MLEAVSGRAYLIPPPIDAQLGRLAAEHPSITATSSLHPCAMVLMGSLRCENSWPRCRASDHERGAAACSRRTGAPACVFRGLLCEVDGPVLALLLRRRPAAAAARGRDVAGEA